MSTPPDRIIHPTINADGSLHYASVMSPSSDKSLAICYMVPDRIIPVIFVPGIMGSNLMDSHKNPVWRVDNNGSMAGWVYKNPSQRKQLLDPTATQVDGRGALPTGTKLSEAEMRRRGWGEVAAMSYGDFLPWLESVLNDYDHTANYGRDGERAALVGQIIGGNPALEPLTHDEVATSYRYQFPVHAVGYNWLQSNADSAQRLKAKIAEFIDYYHRQGRRCEKVILVTHSMGGLVTRYYTRVLGDDNTVMGIVHGVMPATGAAAAYKRVKAGTERDGGITKAIAAKVLGDTAATITAVFAQAPGALQLLPSTDYGTSWLKISVTGRVVSLPKQEPYNEIYLQRGKWWGLIDDKLINPLDTKKQTVEKDWNAFTQVIKNDVKNFHTKISDKYHSNTYAFYGDDPAHKTWGDVTWRRTLPMFIDDKPSSVAFEDGHATWDSGQGRQSVLVNDPQAWGDADFVLQDADEAGDGTVPKRSGKAPSDRRGVQACMAYAGIDHESAYNDAACRQFALWAITKIAYRVKETSLAYAS